MILSTPQDIDVPGATQVRWIQQGIVRPQKPANGRGPRCTRGYSSTDLVILRAAQALRTHGLGLDAIRRVSRTLYDHLDRGRSLPRDSKLILSKQDIVIAREVGQWMAALRHPETDGCRIVVDIGSMAQDVGCG